MIINVVVDESDHFEKLVTKLIYQHCHSNSTEFRNVVIGYLTDGLDYDEAEKVIDRASEELSFVEVTSDYVWYEQNEAMLKFVRDSTSHDLGIIGSQFSHLTPPSLRDEYNLPPPTY